MLHQPAQGHLPERIGIPVTDLITHRFPLDQIQDAFETNLRQEGIKVVVEAR